SEEEGDLLVFFIIHHSTVGKIYLEGQDQSPSVTAVITKHKATPDEKGSFLTSTCCFFVFAAEHYSNFAGTNTMMNSAEGYKKEDSVIKTRMILHRSPCGVMRKLAEGVPNVVPDLDFPCATSKERAVD
ncbi:hypothetical protein ACJX0J_028884, partial [Zea mays]